MGKGLLLIQMALLSKFSKLGQVDRETGLSTNASMNGGRFFQKNGRPNIHVDGMEFWRRLNLYHELLHMHYLKFLFVILSFFIGINLLFALIYMAIGIDHLGGMVANTLGEKFGEAFFFSAQTFTTVGYGRINPIGFLASTVAAIEALMGLLCFALATGLLYGRFARPRAFIHFSKNALIAPFKEGRALMLRMVPYTKNHLTEVEAKVTLAIQVEVDGVRKNQFFTLPLDIAKANTLAMNWTLVHVINETSPLYKLSADDLAAAKAELLVFVQGFDESFSSTVVTRSSYTWNEFVFGAKFTPMYNPSNDGSKTVLHLNKLSDYEPATLPDE
ncbi:MAG: hypothetical protein J0L83_02595 [Chitinophagales bacterium]|nr:hypothetical protein [Chitinophagales bacterium]